MNPVDFLAEKIYDSYGTINRCRFCYLYTAKGVRLTDMYQEGGRAILGWGGSSSYTVLKDVLSKGATGSFITSHSFRLEKAVSTLFNSARKTFVFTEKKNALQASLLVSSKGSSFWKPWNDCDVNPAEIDCIIFEPPFASCEKLYILAVKEEVLDSEKSKLLEEFYSENKAYLSSALNAGVTRSVYNLIKALQERSEKDWFRYDKVLCRYWERKGPYLYPKVTKEKYTDFMLHCLSLGYVISPVYEKPSIVPYSCDEGVFNALKKNPFQE